MSSSYLRRTVRGRLLALAIVVEALMLALMVANSLRLLQDAMTDQARWEAELIAPVIRAALVAPLAQHDFATVLAVINETQATQGIEYISVADRSGKLVASSGWPDDRKLPGPSTEFGRFNDDRSRFDVAAPIFQNSQRLGTLHFGLNLSHIVAARRHLLAQSVSIAIVELLLSSGILLLLGYWLTRHLTALTRASLEVAAGNLTPSPVPEGGDDFGRLGAAFNTMSRAIAQRIQDLVAAGGAAEFANEQLRREIGDRGRIEEALRRSEDFVRSILDNVDQGLIVVDREYTIVLANKAFCRMKSVLPEEIIGRPSSEILKEHSGSAPEDGEWFIIRKVFETAIPCSSVGRHTGAQNSVYFAESKAFPMRDATGVVGSVIVTVQDISEKHLLEEERLRIQKLQAVGTLAGGIAHDFNNLLQGIFGYIYLAKLKIDDRGKALAMLEEAEHALGTAVNLTTQLLTFSKGGKPAKRLLSLKPVIEDSVHLALSGSDAEGRMNIAPDLWPVEADEGQLIQVLQNIVLNAKQAMASKGTVDLLAWNQTLAKNQKAGLPAGGEFVRVDIKDTGVGIPEENLTLIFDPYFTTKLKGNGLGLATSFSIIKNHGGLIEVESEAGKGSTFSVYLPAAKDAVVPALNAASVLSVRKARVLVMDDDELIRNIGCAMIEALGHEPVCVSDGGEAIERFRHGLQAGNPFDVVILDLTVKGGMGGEEAISRLLEIDPKVKAVVSSGYADSSVVANYREHGFSAILNKPYRAEALRECLNSLLWLPSPSTRS